MKKLSMFIILLAAGMVGLQAQEEGKAAPDFEVNLLGGGTVGLMTRSVHLLSAVAFSGSAVLMFLVWIKDMLPTFYDLKWMIIMGGYLSKEKKPVPAGKFNAGQKMWFWLATLGGGVMAVTGCFLYSFPANMDTLRLSAIIHSFLGAAMMAMFLVHMYMSIAAIKGSYNKMQNEQKKYGNYLKNLGVWERLLNK